jgi:hypothetical protein
VVRDDVRILLKQAHINKDHAHRTYRFNGMDLDEHPEYPDKGFFVRHLICSHNFFTFFNIEWGRSQGKPFLNLGRGNKLVSRTTYPLKPLIKIRKSKKNA